LITVTRSDSEITIQGHAGYAPPGQDIVCAAISALTQTFILSVEELTTDKIKYDIRPGMAYITYEDLSERGQVLLDSLFIGIHAIADDYSDHIRIIAQARKA